MPNVGIVRPEGPSLQLRSLTRSRQELLGFLDIFASSSVIARVICVVAGIMYLEEPAGMHSMHVRYSKMRLAGARYRDWEASGIARFPVQRAPL